MVPGAGLEPARPQGRGILSLSRTTLALTGIHPNPGKYRIGDLFIECQSAGAITPSWTSDSWVFNVVLALQAGATQASTLNPIANNRRWRAVGLLLIAGIFTVSRCMRGKSNYRNSPMSPRYSNSSLQLKPASNGLYSHQFYSRTSL